MLRDEGRNNYNSKSGLDALKLSRWHQKFVRIFMCTYTDIYLSQNIRIAMRNIYYQKISRIVKKTLFLVTLIHVSTHALVH